MTLLMVDRYVANNDSTSIAFKRYNQSPQDKYPTFSICFKGNKFRWYHDLLLFNAYGVTPTEYGLMLMGETAFRHEYNYKSRMYRKVTIGVENVTDVRVDQFHLLMSDILVGLEFVTDNPENSTIYRNGKHENLVEKPPFDIGYQTPDTICFSRKSNDVLNSIRMHDWLSLNRSVLNEERFHDTELQIFIHYPGQLLRSFDTPSFTTIFPKIHSNKSLVFELSRGTLARKRSDSNHPCNNEIQDHDIYLQSAVSKHIGCIPPYWKGRLPDDGRLGECKSLAKLKDAYRHIKNYQQELPSYDIPCEDLYVSTMYHMEVTDDDEEYFIRFVYKEKYFEEIEHNKDFGVESFWSAIGGFVGIFVGYSVMQLPELLGKIISLFCNLKIYY